MATAQKHTQQDAAGGSAVKSALIVFVMIIAGILLLPFGVLMLIGMLPSIVAWMVDVRREKNAALCVAMLNFCGVAPQAITLISRGATLNASLEILKDPMNLATMYAAAAIGWMLIMAMPPIMGFLFNVRSEETIRKLEARKQKLLEEWGDTLKQASVEINPEELPQEEI